MELQIVPLPEEAAPRCVCCGVLRVELGFVEDVDRLFCSECLERSRGLTDWDDLGEVD